jgi:hypothetical protein
MSKKDTPFYVPLIAGGIGGTTYWAFNYPLDYVKTLMQSDSFENPKYKGNCFLIQDLLTVSRSNMLFQALRAFSRAM